MSQFSVSQIEGVVPALVSTFDQNEKLDLQRAKNLTNYLCDKKIGGLYLTGSTGEGFLMSSQERKDFVETVVETVAGRVPVIVHVGAMSTMASEELAKHAASVGADAISSVPPFYWNFSNDAIAGYYSDIVQSSGLEMIVYNIALAGLVSYDMLIRLGKIDGVSGVKYTASSHFDYFRIKETLGDDFRVYSGSDEMALSGLNFGADGLIGSTYNVIADEFIQLLDQFQKGDLKGAQMTQQHANRMIFAMLKYELIPTLKILLNSEHGVDAGWSRRPFKQYSQEETAAIIETFRQAKNL